jgi:hypothetical protein
MAIVELASVTAALGALKTISDIAKNMNNIELMQKIIEFAEIHSGHAADGD